MKPCLTLIALILLPSGIFAQRAIVATTDFTTGSLSTMDTQTRTTENDLLLIHSDAAVRTHGDRVYVLNKLNGDNIIVLSKDNLATPLTQYSLGNGSNPHNIAFKNEERAYVTLYERDYVIIINPATGDSLGSIDLSGFADADGIPEASMMAVLGNHLFIAIQRLNRDAFFSPADYSTIAVVDTDTEALLDIDPAEEGIQGIRLEGAQPFGHVQRGPLWILSAVGSFGTQDGGIEVVNLLTMETEGLSLTEATLGGDVGPMTMLTDTDGYVVVTDENFANSVRPFSLAAGGSVSDALSDHSGGFTPSVSILGSELYVLDRGSFTDPASAGIKVYDTATNALTVGPLSTGLPPSDITFVDVRPADFDGDNDVDFDDFLRFAGAFGKTLDTDGYDSSFDLTPNGSVDFNDFLVFAEGFGK